MNFHMKYRLHRSTVQKGKLTSTAVPEEHAASFGTGVVCNSPLRGLFDESEKSRIVNLYKYS